MEAHLLPLLIGFFFGGGLVLGGLADPDKIVGTLRLKDFHAMRTIGVFVLVGMLGTWILQMADLAYFSVKPAAMVGVSVGGALLGAGFGMTGYCPGTGLACAISGRIDALMTVLGMFVGALAFILGYDKIVTPIDKTANLGKITLPVWTNTSPALWVIPLVVGGGLLLFLTRPKKSPQTGCCTNATSPETQTPCGCGCSSESTSEPAAVGTTVTESACSENGDKPSCDCGCDCGN